MANIKSQKKRALTNVKRHSNNVSKKSELKTSIKRVLQAIEAKDKEAAVKAFDACSSLLDASVRDHIKHSNYASRQKSRLQKAINTLG